MNSAAADPAHSSGSDRSGSSPQLLAEVPVEDALPIDRLVERLSPAEMVAATLNPSLMRKYIVDLIKETGPKPLADGTLGYFTRGMRSDDCFAAAAATVLQVPIESVPDVRLDERLAAGDDPAEIDHDARAEWVRWLSHRGLRIVVHRTVPVARRRWIGVVVLPAPGRPFNDHCLVMSHGNVLFDPVDALEHVCELTRDPRPLVRWRARDVSYGLSFQSSNRREE